MIPARPIAPNLPTSDTAYPGMAEVRERTGRRTFLYIDFSWMEDVLAAWRGVAVFGGLLFVEGCLVWLGAVGYGGFTQAPLIAATIFLIFGCALVAFLGYAEASLALVAAIAVNIGLIIFDPPAWLPNAGALFTSSPDVVADQVTIMYLWIFGFLMLGLGTVFAVEAYREIDFDE